MLCKDSPLFLLLVLICLTTSSCGYRFGRGELVQRYQAVCIPYVDGDDDGYFTTTLIQAFNARGCLSYRSCGADLLLKVCLFAPVERNIGFIFPRPKERKLKKRQFSAKTDWVRILSSHEARLSLVARISLIDNRTQETILGPLSIESFIDYDFEPDLSHVDSHQFALGQLEMHNLAQDAALIPLYERLAEKVVDYVNNSW